MLNTLPNQLTLFRIALIPIFAVIFYLPFRWSHVLSAAVFGIAALTDLLDGWIARRTGQMSRFGAFLDPVADKLMVVTALVLLIQTHPDVYFILPAMIIIGRELVISALREWMAEIGERAQVAVSMIGKIKTTVQMIALLLLLYREPIWVIPVETVGMVCLYIAAVLTLWSMTVYLKAAWPSMKNG